MPPASTTYRNHHYDESNRTYTIQISEYIGDWVTDPEIFAWRLERYPDLQRVILETSSDGGDPISAIAVGNQLRRLKRTKNVEVLGDVIGFVASAATILLVTGCERIRMEQNSMWLVHKLEAYVGWVTDTGAERAVENIKRIESLIVNIYMRRTGKSEEEIRNLLERDIWLTPQEALDWGFIDEIYEDPSVNTTQFENSVAYQNYIKKGGTPVPKTKIRNSENSNNMSIETKKQPQTKPKVKQSNWQKFVNATKELFVVVEESEQAPVTETPEAPPTTTPVVQNAVETTTSVPVAATEVPEVPAASDTDGDDVSKLRNEMKALQTKFVQLEARNKALENTPPGKTIAAVTQVQNLPSIQVGDQVYDLTMRNQNPFSTTYNEKAGKYQLTKNRNFLNHAELKYLRDNKPHLFQEQVKLMTRNNCCPDFSTDPLSSVSLSALETELGNLTAHVPALNEIMFTAFNLGRAANIAVVPGGILNHKYYSIIGEVGEVIQPINGCNYNSKGDMDFLPHGNMQRGWKIDKDVCPTNFYQGYFSYLNSNNFNPWSHPFVSYMLMKLIEGGVRDDLNLPQWFGQYDANSTDAVAVYDGFWTIINTHTTAANIIPMAPFNPATDSAVEYVETFIKGFPVHWQFSMIPISINLPTHISGLYLKEYREKYKSNAQFTDDGGNPLQTLRVWLKPNMRLVPTLGMGIGDRLLGSVDGTLYYRRGNSVNGTGNPMVQQCKRSLAVMIDVVGSAMISTLTPGYIVTSDQPEQQHAVSVFNPNGLNVTYPSLA